jgi:hypothetical protein
MVTAPVQKSTILDAGVAFTGHTEYLAQRTGTPHVVMMLVGGELRVALATTHLPLAAVPAAITQASLETTLGVLDHDLRTRFRIARPRILVAGLNPHAGTSAARRSSASPRQSPRRRARESMRAGRCPQTRSSRRARSRARMRCSRCITTRAFRS